MKSKSKLLWEMLKIANDPDLEAIHQHPKDLKVIHLLLKAILLNVMHVEKRSKTKRPWMLTS